MPTTATPTLAFTLPRNNPLGNCGRKKRRADDVNAPTPYVSAERVPSPDQVADWLYQQCTSRIVQMLPEPLTGPHLEISPLTFEGLLSPNRPGTSKMTRVAGCDEQPLLCLFSDGR